MSTNNQLVYNRLVYNRLVYNRLAQSQIADHRLSPNEMLYSAQTELHTTSEGRELLEYAARCALASGDVLVVEHDGVSYPMSGLLGLAPEWEHGGISDTEARLVSACLLAHVNAYGVSVAISLRSPGYLGATDQEKIDYPVHEATFFGDVFGDELRTYACLGSDPAIAAAHASSRVLRVCADGTPDCEIEAVGYCRDVCDSRVGDRGWVDCWAGGVQYAETMSTFLLHDGGPGGTNGYYACHKHDCKVTANVASSMFDCAGTDECSLNCQSGAVCTLLHVGHHMEAKAEASDGAAAELECHGASKCRARCEGTDTRCAIDCTGARDCDHVECKEGATCAIDCTDADHCGFSECHGPLVQCPGDIVVCNGSCP